MAIEESTGMTTKDWLTLRVQKLERALKYCQDDKVIMQNHIDVLEAELESYKEDTSFAVCHHCEQVIPKPEWDDHWKACENSPYKSLIAERQEMLEYMNEEVGTEHLPEEWQLEGGD